MHAVIKTSTYTNVIPLIIAVYSLAHSLHNQVTYHVKKFSSHYKTHNNSPCSWITKLPYTALA